MNKPSSCTRESKHKDVDVLQSCFTFLVPQTSQAFPPDTFLNVHYLTPAFKPSTASLILFPNQAEWICANPEPRENLLLDAGFELVDQPHLLLALALHQEELDDAGGLVDVDAHSGGQGELDVHVLAVVPHLVAGARPAGAPGVGVLPDAAGPVLALPGRALTDQPDNHPAIVVHLPVPSMAHQTLLTQHLKQGGQGQSKIDL